MNRRFIFCLFLLPFSEIGYSYYISVPAICAIIILASGKNNFSIFLRDNATSRIAICVAMVFSCAVNDKADQFDILWAIRTAVFYFLITGSSRLSIQGAKEVSPSKLMRFIIYVFTPLLLLEFAQMFFYSRGTYVGIPVQYFVQNGETLPGELALIYSNPRPSATYGEPSYLGGICLSMIFALSPAIERNKLARQISVLLSGMVAIARTLTGIGAIIVYAVVFFFLRSRRFTVPLIAASAFGIFAFVAVSTDLLPERLSAIKAGNDASSLDRIFLPVKIIPSILSSDPLGIPLKKFIEIGYISGIGSAGSDITQNSLLNLIINFGWVGVAGVVILLVSIRDMKILTYILLISVQNGGLFSIDKFYIIAMSIMIHNTLCASFNNALITSDISSSDLDRNPANSAVRNVV